MPQNIYGERADIIMDPSAVAARMNAGRIYEIYFNAASRHNKYLITNALKCESSTLPISRNEALPLGVVAELKPLHMYSMSVIQNAYNTLLGFLKILDTPQYYAYAKVTDRKQMEIVLQEILEKELFIHYRLNSSKRPYQVVTQLKGTIHEPIREQVTFKVDGVTKISKEKIRIAPVYTIILAKTADNFLSAASAKVNHYGVAIGVGNAGKYSWPWRNSPVKILSETESRLYAAYCGRIALAELKDRGGSIETHKLVVKNILNSDRPTNIPQVVDRALHPYGGDAAMEMVNSILNASGMGVKYVYDKTQIHPVKQ